MSKIIHILGGGTFNHVRNHLALAAPAFGKTARKLYELIYRDAGLLPRLTLTKMADSYSELVTNADVEAHVDLLIKDPNTRAIIFNVAMCDFEGKVGNVKSGKYATRLQSADDYQEVMSLSAAEKIIGRIRKERKDIFVVGFKTTAGADRGEQYAKALRLLKNNSLNLVLANDTVTRNNMIVAPEETKYCETKNRDEVLAFLAKMVISRCQNTFTRSTVVPGHQIAWNSPAIPANLREVVDYCIVNDAYKPVLGKTAGHFAVKLNDRTILTSVRKSNYNEKSLGLVQVESTGPDEVKAYGAKPSVGGQSQRIIFANHVEDCIVHFHCPPKDDAILMPVHPQWPNECGSHECGRATSDNLQLVDLGDGDSLKVVYLDDHGPNIVFKRETPAAKVKDFIAANFDLSRKTGGLAATLA